MNQRKLALAGTATAAIVAAIAFAGPLNPPAGNVQQLSDAIAGLAAGSGSCANSPTLTGQPVAPTAQLFINGAGPYRIDEWRFINEYPRSPGPGGSSFPVAAGYSFKRVLDENYVPLLDAYFRGTLVRDMEIIVNDTSGNPIVLYAFENVIFDSVATAQLQTCTGALFAEEVLFTPTEVKIRDLVRGTETAWNFVTNLPG